MAENDKKASTQRLDVKAVGQQAQLCPNCGTPRVANDKFCRKCGFNYTAFDQAASTPTVALDRQEINKAMSKSNPPADSATTQTQSVPASKTPAIAAIQPNAVVTNSTPTPARSNIERSNMSNVNVPASAPQPSTPGNANAAVVSSVSSGEETPISRTSITPKPGKAVELENVSVFYGKHQAVKNVNMKIDPNQITALIGPSGCGKSTLLRAINRMHDFTRGARVTGAIEIDHQNIYDNKIDPVITRRRVGMVFQRPNPFPADSIFENVVSGLKAYGEANPHKLQRVAEEALRSAFLWDEVKDKLDEPGTSLSGGQQQRLCIARTIAVEPEVILMDEPCSALDPIATLHVEELMLELKKRYTIVIVTHNMQQASRVSDKTAFMLAGVERTGELVEYTSTKKIFTNPSDKRTEDYISGKFG